MCPSEGFFLGGDMLDVKKPEYLCKMVEKYQDRGCKIENIEQALMILSKINYYKLSAYFLPFKIDEDHYKPGTSLIQVYRIYEFDRKLSSVLYGVIQTIEVFIKTQIAYYHSIKYGALGYLDVNTVNNKFSDKHENLIEIFNREVKHNQDLLFVKHHEENYNGKYPLWVAIELFSLGNTSQFFSQLKTLDRKTIARSISYITKIKITHDQIASCLQCLTILRNKCAHFSRIYQSRFPSYPYLPKSIESDAYAFGKKFIYLYPYLYVLKVLYPAPEDWGNIVTNISSLINEYNDDINIRSIGFPEDWEEKLRTVI